MSLYSNILVAVDFSPATESLIKRALDMFEPGKGRLTLVHIVDYLPPLGFPDDLSPAPALMLDEEALIQSANESLKRVAAGVQREPPPRLEVRLGTPKSEIIQLAEELGCDLLILGARGRRGLERLLGSTATAVLAHAPCDVLAVHTPPRNTLT
ncbi:MAG: universal stress protein [Gammaproteobacteria bacterium]|nr:universal stress protein [Gammaproteobacteria bacterium]